MDIVRKRGDTYPIEITVLADGVALDVTDATFLLTVDPSKSPVDNTSNLFQLVGVITDPVAGKVLFTPSDPQADHVGKFYYDIQMIDSSTAKRTIAEGKYTLTQDITKN